MFDANDIKSVIDSSPWRNVYWFTRNLLNTDQYGAIGKNEKLMQEILLETKAILIQNLSDDDKLTVCQRITKDKVINSARPGTKTMILKEEFLSYLDVVVDGKFEDDKKDIKLRFRGSSNQRIIDVKKSLKEKKAVLFEF